MLINGVVQVVATAILLMSDSVRGFAPNRKAPVVVFGEAEEPKFVNVTAEEWSPSDKREKRFSENDLHHFYRSTESTCTGEYSKIPDHTMCLTDKPNVEESGLKDGDAQLIVNEHNRFRGMVEPPATDLPKMVWNEKIAAVAQKWAKQCVLAHDKVRDVPELHQPVGQNVAAGHAGWAAAIKDWYEEIFDWRYGEDPKIYLAKGLQIGHFTQLASNTTMLVGCGYASCSNSNFTKYYVCNYAAGQTRDTMIYPYTKGERCSACPDTCSNGVCDCKGKFCKNRGKLDLKTCTCTCEVPFTGDTCSDAMCPPEDNPVCGTTWTEDFCTKYINVPNKCPYMCNVCSEKDKQVFADVAPGSGITVNGMDYYKSKHGCTFYGHRPSKEVCSGYGKNGDDKTFACASHGGKFDCDDCSVYDNVGPQYCPVMCGLCDERDMSAFETVEPGSGITVNGVSFYKSTHGCGFWGDRPSADTCATMGDNGKDMKMCASEGGTADCDMCEKYSNIATDYCPVMCGECDG